jgi:diadenosine tetraphosphatase ApaH/serine/threonine PP2A family protein phosphatase
MGFMGTFAVISDVHGNLEALQAVLARIDELKIEAIYSLGDVIGYGPDPEACVLLTESRCCLRLMGNHEHALLHPDEGMSFNASARDALDWTRQRIRQAGLLDRLGEPEPCHQSRDILFAHGAVRNTLNEYLQESDRTGYSTFDELVESLENDFIDFRICFVGHNHKPFLATTEGFLHPHPGLNDFHVAAEERLYVSVGSVGQPRDGDPRACFVTFDGSQVTFHRVAYPVATTAGKIRSRALPERLAERLAVGL